MSQGTPFTDWHLLDARAIWVKELAGALARQVKLTCWMPEISWTGYLKQYERVEAHANPVLELRHFPLQRGFAKWPLRGLLQEDARIARRLRGHTQDESKTALVCVACRPCFRTNHAQC